VAAPKGAPLKFELSCNKCGASATHEFDYALVNPEREKHKAEGWDGIFLPRIVECSRCGAVDDYRLGSRSYMTLMAETLKFAFSEKKGPGRSVSSRIMVGISQLWDGTTARRPSQVLAHLKKLTEEQPKCGEAWRRLGNAEERFGKMDAAEKSWRKALEVAPKDLESAFSLAKHLEDCERWPEAAGFLRTAIRLLPGAREADAAHRLKLSEALVELLRRVLDVTDEPLALMAGWAGNETKKAAVVNVSSVDVRKIESWDRLSEFLVRPNVMMADLTTEMPEHEPTNLQRLLADDWTELPVDVVRSLPKVPVFNEHKRVGPNAPCPCGSGKKHKRCCGR
jgi:tetratricopeptide (TPR) repeat protein